MKGMPLRPAPLVFAIALALGSAILSLPAELAQVKRDLALPSQDVPLRLVVLAALLSHSLVALGVGLLPILLGARRIGDRALRGLALAVVLLVLAAIGVDLELQRNTGHHLADYAPYLLDPETFVWAGPGFDAGPSILRVVRGVALAVGPAMAIAWQIGRAHV